MPARRRNFLMLGPDEGWHARQLKDAAESAGHALQVASYESLAARHVDSSPVLTSEAGSLTDFDAVLTRTMPRGTLEQITFRLAVLHQLEQQGVPLINPPRALEQAIDKFAALATLADLGLPTPPTQLVQSRDQAMMAFADLGGDCVVKPLFGGEGRGVMRVTDRELAWYAFSSLEQLGAVIQLQKFIPPGGRDTRLLVVGENVYGIRRENRSSFRSNVAAGATSSEITLTPELIETAKQITRRFGLHFGSVDIIDNDQGPDLYLEVNAVPGWRGAQRVAGESIADRIIETLDQLCEARDV
ncbi:MAG: RimK family alpha-L-glutamate ligase [Planctomycetota bacterium]